MVEYLYLLLSMLAFDYFYLFIFKVYILCLLSLVPYVLSVDVYLVVTVLLGALFICLSIEVPCDINVRFWEEPFSDAKSDSFYYCEEKSKDANNWTPGE